MNSSEGDIRRPLDNRIDRETYFTRCWRANDRRFRNTELPTIKDGRTTDVEVYFGWSIPHKAPAGAFVTTRATHDDKHDDKH